MKRGVFFRLLGLGYETATRVLTLVKIVRTPVAELLASASEERCLLIGERIQDPRNVGVLIRTAEAWGLKAIAFTEGLADPFSRASVRSTTGSILRVRVTTGVETGELLRGLRDRGVRLVGSSAGAETPSWSVDSRRRARWWWGMRRRGCRRRRGRGATRWRGFRCMEGRIRSM